MVDVRIHVLISLVLQSFELMRSFFLVGGVMGEGVGMSVRSGAGGRAITFTGLGVLAAGSGFGPEAEAHLRQGGDGFFER